MNVMALHSDIVLSHLSVYMHGNTLPHISHCCSSHALHMIVMFSTCSSHVAHPHRCCSGGDPPTTDDQPPSQSAHHQAYSGDQ